MLVKNVGHGKKRSGNASTSELREHLGGKAANLRTLENLGYNVPAFSVVSKNVLDSILNEVKLKTEPNHSLKEILELIENDTAILNKLGERIGINALEDGLYAVRSSAQEEDHEKLSYAGQFDSFLNVKKSDISKFVLKVWKSAYGQKVLAYKKLKGAGLEITLPCVIIQEMVTASYSGVAFSADPVTGDESTVVICCVKGLADKLVDGTTDGTTYTFKNGKLKNPAPESDEGLSNWQLKKLHSEVRSIAKEMNCPQDIEWAYQNNRLFILQSRAITKFFKSPTQERVDIFDNSNIQESYPGVTLPLTFSFANTAYKNVYLEFAKLMGVSDTAIQANKDIFPLMLGYKNGRIYYNLLNWYRLLKLFPGYQINKQFMEQMMGLSEKLDPTCLASIDSDKDTNKSTFSKQYQFFKSLVGLINQFNALDKTTQKFYGRLDHALALVPDDLTGLSNNQLIDIYKELEDALITKWDAPIVNDFFAMIFYGLLKKLSNDWIAVEGIHNQLLCGETGIVSTEPTKLLYKMAGLAKADGDLLIRLENYNQSIGIESFQDKTLFYKELKNYLAKFGDRSQGELKLESKSLTDDPRAIISAIKALARRADLDSIEDSTAQNERVNAEYEVAKALKHSRLKSFIYKLVLKQARERIKARENLRFERTRVFGVVRRLFNQIGANFEAQNLLSLKDDIFYLETEEIFRHHYGNSSVYSLKKLVELRKSEFEIYENQTNLPDRFRTVNGVVDYSSNMPSSNQAMPDKDILTGVGCCPGVVLGQVAVITDPNTESLEGFDILIAERTDPGWITVISQAKAIVVEYGSLLSHTAIVARELGIPTIVACKGVTSLLSSGDTVEVDGQSGEVKIKSKTISQEPMGSIDKEIA